MELSVDDIARHIWHKRKGEFKEMIRKDLESLPAYVPGARMDDAVKLSSNESSLAPLPAAAKAMSEAAAGVNRYPDMGAVELRTQLAAHLGVEFEQTAVGAGSSALCQQLVQATTTADNEVVFPWRSFEAYPIFAQVVGATPVPVALTAGQAVDLEGIAAAVTEKTSLIFICNPNNPSGTTISNDEFEAFMAKIPSNIVVGLDEAYFEYNRAENQPVATEVITKYDNVVGLRTFSKAYGLAGARVGYAFGPQNIIEAVNKVAIPFSVNSVAQAGAVAALEAKEELKERIDEAVIERARIVDALSAWGAIPSEANFVWCPKDALSKQPQELAALLADAGVLVRAFPEGIRITSTTAFETDVLLKAIESVS